MGAMKNLDRSNCPIVRATNVLRDQWSFLVMREFFLEGPRRFSDLKAMTGASPNTLSDRLKRLEEAGVIERRMYSQHPPRAEYILTQRGEALAPVIGALVEWGLSETPDL